MEGEILESLRDEPAHFNPLASVHVRIAREFAEPK